jgi:hypothetical protein
VARGKTARATTSFVAFVDGQARPVAAGELLPANDPLVKANPSFFEVPVEQATAAPGERRRR